jgi:hypothetical protein
MTVSKSTRTRNRSQISRAQIKAYEARRAEEMQRAVAARPAADTSESQVSSVRRSRVQSRTEEFQTIKADLRRLAIILVIMTALLIAATIVLR